MRGSKSSSVGGSLISTLVSVAGAVAAIGKTETTDA